MTTTQAATDLWRLDATELAFRIRTGQVSSREAVESALARMEQVNPAINAVVRSLAEEARAAADAADTAQRRGDALGPLHGVPVTTKVNVDQAGCPTDNGVVAFKDVVATVDAPMVANLKRAGAVVIGRTNTPAFSMRWFTENDLHGRTLNPWDAGRTPGGSSGGAAASVATGIGAIAHGNDIAGSIRYPAYCCGVVGIRPTIGRVPAVSTTAPPGRPLGAQLMAVNGPLTRTVRDARLALAVMSCRDERDPRWIDAPLEGPPPPRPVRVAIVPEPEGAPVHPAISEAIRTAGRYLSAAGFAVEEAAPPDIDAVADLWHVFGVTENLEALWPRVEQMGDDDARRSMTHWRAFRPAATLERYFAAHLERDAYLQRWNDFFLQYPIVIMPNSGEPAFPQRLDAGDFADAERALIANRFQLPAAVLGLPGLSVPVGSVDGVPLGVQINANRYREDLCLLAGEVIEACEGPRTPIDPVR